MIDPELYRQIGQLQASVQTLQDGLIRVEAKVDRLTEERGVRRGAWSATSALAAVVGAIVSWIVAWYTGHR